MMRHAAGGIHAFFSRARLAFPAFDPACELRPYPVRDARHERVPMQNARWQSVMPQSVHPFGNIRNRSSSRGRARGRLPFSLHRRAPRKRGFSYAATPNALRGAVGRGAAPPSPRLRARGRVRRPRPLDPSRRPCAVSNIPRAPGLVGEPSAPRPIENRAAPSHSRRRGAGHGKPPSSGRLLTSPALLENPGSRPRPSASSPRLRRLEA